MILGTTSFISLQIKWLCLHYKVALASIWHHPTAVPEANTLGTVSHSIAPRICQNLKIQSGEKIDMLLWKLSVRSLSIWWKHFWFASKHTYFIQMLEQMGLSGADRQAQLSWAWYTAQRDEQGNTRAFQLRKHKCSFRITTAWQTEPTHNSTSLFRKVSHMVPLCYQRTSI